MQLRTFKTFLRFLATSGPTSQARISKRHLLTAKKCLKPLIQLFGHPLLSMGKLTKNTMQREPQPDSSKRPNTKNQTIARDASTKVIAGVLGVTFQLAIAALAKTTCPVQDNRSAPMSTPSKRFSICYVQTNLAALSREIWHPTLMAMKASLRSSQGIS